MNTEKESANDGGPAFPYVTASEAVREVTTHEGEGEQFSPWGMFVGRRDPEPMIAALEKAEATHLSKLRVTVDEPARSDDARQAGGTTASHGANDEERVSSPQPGELP